jgi:endo-1,4-beta-xylanase
VVNTDQETTIEKLKPSAIRERIKKLRMGSITVQTSTGADVEVTQIRHEFPFGTAITNGLVENDPIAMSDLDRTMFLKILAENFNYAVHENALKWYDCEKQYGVVDYSIADRIWEYCRDLNIPMRGHCIFWEKDEYIMQWLRGLDNDRLRAAIKKRAIGVTEHFKGRIEEFDLNNEMINGEFFRRRLGYGIVNEMAYMARAGNPGINLFVNDYGILCDGGFNAETYLIQIQNLLDSGVPIGGIGCQGHSATFLNVPMSAQHVQATLDKLTRFDLPIKITECLFDVQDEHMQADELRRIFPIYFAHPTVEAILMWGFWEGAHWKPWSALWKKDWTITLQGQAYRDLVFKEWWTRISGKADASGQFKTDAFFGDYIISSKGITQKAALSKKNKSLHVTFN